MGKRRIQTLVNNLQKVSLEELRIAARSFTNDEQLMLRAKLKGFELFLQESSATAGKARCSLYLVGDYPKGRHNTQQSLFLHAIRSLRLLIKCPLKTAKEAIDTCNDGGRVLIKESLPREAVEEWALDFQANGLEVVIEEVGK